MAKASVKKKWYRIVAPRLFNERIVGETAALEAKNLAERTMKVNMFTLTDNIRKQNTEIKLLINSVQGDNAITSMIGFKILPTSVKRLVRKGKTRLDQTIKAITNDNKVITIKMFLVTRNLVKGSVFTAIQNKSKEIVTDIVNNSTYDGLAEAVVYGKIQKEIREQIAKIYPLKICDVREFKLERFVKAVDLRKIKEKTPVKKVEEKEGEEKKEEKAVEEKPKEEKVKEDKEELKADSKEEVKEELKVEETSDKKEEKPAEEKETKEEKPVKETEDKPAKEEPEKPAKEAKQEEQ